jgi:hypothetical protein
MQREREREREREMEKNPYGLKYAVRPKRPEERTPASPSLAFMVPPPPLPPPPLLFGMLRDGRVVPLHPAFYPWGPGFF